MTLPVLTFSLFFCWFDFWIGVYVDTASRAVYICPVPMFGMKIKWRMEKV